MFYLAPQLFDHWTSVVRLSPSPTPVVLPPPADAEVDPAYVESLALDGIRFAYPHLSLSVECESKWAKIGDQWVPMAACWSEGQTEYVFTSIRHFGQSEDDFDMRAYVVEHASPSTVLMTDCYETRGSSQMATDDCVSVVTDFEAAQRLMDILAEWESY